MNHDLCLKFYSLSPILLALGMALLSLMADAFFKNTYLKISSWLSLAGIFLATGFTLSLWNTPDQFFFSGALRKDPFSIFFTGLFLLLSGLTVSFWNDANKENPKRGEFHFFLFSGLSGMILISWATDLMTFFISLEILSLALYVLTAFHKDRLTSQEGALKYFLLGAFSTGFLLLGIVCTYAATGSTYLQDISQYLVTTEHLLSPVFHLGIGLLAIGFGFKVAWVPFHMWVPDAYEGAPKAITAWMATAVKAAGFAIFIRFFLITLLPLHELYEPLFILFSILTMSVGNFLALKQTSIVRMLAYSSIAHAGYIAMAVSAAGIHVFQLSLSAILFYLIVYGFMTMGAFAVVLAVNQKKSFEAIEEWGGLGYDHPWLGLAMSLFMLSLTGIPLTAGFIGKYLIFSATLKAGLYGLAILGILNSLVAACYYLRVVGVMYMKPSERPFEQKSSASLSIGIGLAALGTLAFGILPQGILKIIQTVILTLL
ncbi:MAG: NADH-quinone oxidoreductase subunit N [Deltaproteobacteria bacterium]|nr:NADH-quinone oxidoreductase subunit N [Deltaproteobacteria bacterium]